MAQLKGFIEVVCCSHGHDDAHHSGKKHLINVAHIIEAEETANNRSRFRCNGTWVELVMSFSDLKNLIIGAQ